MAAVGPGRAGNMLTASLAGRGPLCRLDPRGRVVVAAVFAAVVVALSDLGALVLAVAAGLGLAVAAGLAVGPTLRRVAAVDGFVILVLAVLPLTTPGEPLFTLFGLPGSVEGTAQALRIILKANAVMLALLALVGTLDEAALGHALHHLKVPAKLVHLLLLTVRYIAVLAEEYHRLRIAMKARGFVARGDRHTLVAIGHLVGMLLIRALERAERVSAAMRCRGFHGEFHLVYGHRAGPADLRFAALAGVVLLGLAGLDLWGVTPWPGS